jgi:hypothetical protein
MPQLPVGKLMSAEAVEDPATAIISASWRHKKWS